MIGRTAILLTLFVLLTLAMIGCNAGGSAVAMESTIVARVAATLEAAETAAVATPVPPGPTVDMQGTIVARVVATLEAVETAAVATPVPPEPTASPVPTGPSVTPPPKIEAEEYAVYAALIGINPINFDLGSLIVIREQTVAGLEGFERTLEQVGPLPADLVDSYRSRNTATYNLGPELDLEQDYVLLPQDEVSQILRKGGATWADFEANYPGTRGMVSFSRVGFDEDGDTALVEMGVRCGDLCGSGGLYLLVKEEGSWKFERALMGWIS